MTFGMDFLDDAAKWLESGFLLFCIESLFYHGSLKRPVSSLRNVTGLLVLMNSITMMMQLEFEGRLTGFQLGLSILAAVRSALNSSRWLFLFHADVLFALKYQL